MFSQKCIVSGNGLLEEEGKLIPQCSVPHAARFYSSSGAAEKCFYLNKYPFKDQGYCLGMSKSLLKHYFR